MKLKMKDIQKGFVHRCVFVPVYIQWALLNVIIGRTESDFREQIQVIEIYCIFIAHCNQIFGYKNRKTAVG